MLEQSKTELASATDAERRAAEIIAYRYLVVELEQNLIPTAEASRTVDQHKEQNDETWSRAVFATMMGLRSAAADGIRLSQPTQAHEAHKDSTAPYGKEEHMNEELAKRNAEQQPS